MQNDTHLLQKFSTTKAAKTYLEKGAKTKMEKDFEKCWGNRSPPLTKILAPGSINYYKIESTQFSKIPLVSIQKLCCANLLYPKEA